MFSQVLIKHFVFKVQQSDAAEIKNIRLTVWAASDTNEQPSWTVDFLWFVTTMSTCSPTTKMQSSVICLHATQWKKSVTVNICPKDGPVNDNRQLLCFSVRGKYWCHSVMDVDRWHHLCKDRFFTNVVMTMLFTRITFFTGNWCASAITKPKNRKRHCSLRWQWTNWNDWKGRKRAADRGDRRCREIETEVK